MTFDTPLGEFRWIENWISIPQSPMATTNGRTHGIGALADGRIVVFHQADPAVLLYSADGTLLESWGSFPGAHGLTVVEENGEELLWLVDQTTKDVVKTTLHGQVLLQLRQPEHPAYATGRFTPTWLAVAEERFGGNGDLWLADGYGSSLVHRYDKAGVYLGTLDGTEGGGRFNCPHGLSLDCRGKEPVFYIADRGNRRFQVYSTQGTFLRTVGSDFLDSPDMSACLGKYLVVPELRGGITILDAEDQVCASIGACPGTSEKEGWPNERRWISEGTFNSPHGAAVDHHGNIYVVEWIIGGRVTKLERLRDGQE